MASVGREKAVGLKVVDKNDDCISFGIATGRHFAKIISGLTIFIGYMMVGWTKRKEDLHDMIAITKTNPRVSPIAFTPALGCGIEVSNQWRSTQEPNVPSEDEGEGSLFSQRFTNRHLKNTAFGRQYLFLGFPNRGQ